MRLKNQNFKTKKSKENSKNTKMKAAKEVRNFTKHATFL
jgi:hypothetical protein